jgi:hypothetical protein
VTNSSGAVGDFGDMFLLDTVGLTEVFAAPQVALAYQIKTRQSGWAPF